MAIGRQRHRKDGRRGTRPKQSGQVRREKPPKARIKPLLDVVTAVASAAEAEILNLRSPESADRAVSIRFDVALLNRGTNAAKACRLLCAEGFWEQAASAARQLFELVLTAEYVARQTERMATIQQYVQFGLLRRIQGRLAELAYEEETGRAVDTDLAKQLEDLAAHRFERFRTSKGKWWTSWNDMPPRKLSGASPNRLRSRQYELLYSAWSEQTHASPSAVLDSMFLTEDDFDALIASDDVRAAELIGTAVTLLIELWHSLPEIPGPDPVEVAAWQETLLQWAARYGGTPAPTTM